MIKVNIILSSLFLILPSGCYSLCFSNKIISAFLAFPIRVTCPTHHNLLHYTALKHEVSFINHEVPHYVIFSIPLLSFSLVHFVLKQLQFMFFAQVLSMITTFTKWHIVTLSSITQNIEVLLFSINHNTNSRVCI
jgi:hypothetical protein